jgi:dCTP deaminase
MARIGLEHLNAGWCDAGWNNSVLTLELKNMTQYHTIMLQKGDKIGQMVFFEHEPVPHERSYAVRGRYNNDSTVSGVKV